MHETFESCRVLITVMTYPHPSTRYKELVCTAGISAAGEWVRLYPIDYRYRPQHQQFHKYQWIDVELTARGSGNDNRKESRKPRLDTIRLHGEPLPTDDEWEARRKIVDRMPHCTVNALRQLHLTDRTSLGIVRPKKIIDLEIRTTPTGWKPEWQAIFDQMQLFGPPPKPLRKLPFTFHYVFECEDSEKPHTAMIEDWELGTLFIKEAARLGSDDEAAKSVRHKFLDTLCAPTRDTRFFMGTRFPYNTWLVLGVFWPPKIAQPRLFE